MVLHLSDLGPSCCEIQDLGPPPSSNNDQDKMELARKKKAKMNNSETEATFSSSDHSCFVALVTASNLHTDALYLPKDFTSSNVLKIKCGKIVLTDGGERSWALDLRLNKSSDTFYITQGWRSFCDENGRKQGGFLVFKLVGNGETPLLSFNDGTDKNDKESCMELESKKNHLRCRDSTSLIKNRFVTLTLLHESFKKGFLCLPLPFMRENGLDKPQLITLLGKDGAKWKANLRRESKGGRMRLGKGWKDFAKANGLKTGKSFTLELIWKDTTPMLSLFRTDSSSDRLQRRENCSKASEKEFVSTEPSSGNKIKEAKNNIEERRYSSPGIQNQFVTLTLKPEDVRDCKLILPSQFMKANGIDKLGKITLLGKERMKYSAFLLTRDGFVALGIDWKGFCEANGVKTGESFTLERIYEQDTTTPVLKFVQSPEFKSM